MGQEWEALMCEEVQGRHCKMSRQEWHNQRSGVHDRFQCTACDFCSGQVGNGSRLQHRQVYPVKTSLCVPVLHERRPSVAEGHVLLTSVASISNIAPLFSYQVFSKCLRVVESVGWRGISPSLPSKLLCTSSLIWSVHFISTRHLIAKSFLHHLQKLYQSPETAGLSGSELGLRRKEMTAGSFN